MNKGKEKIRILAIGRLRSGPEAELQEYYRSRIAWPTQLEEFEDRKDGPGQKTREGELLKAALTRKKPSLLVALDEKGREFSSREFATWMEKAVERGDLGFLIGGADGLIPDLKEEADLLLAFGRMTWPHKIARIMLLEQLYRAGQILAQHPYHRD